MIIVLRFAISWYLFNSMVLTYHSLWWYFVVNLMIRLGLPQYCSYDLDNRFWNGPETLVFFSSSKLVFNTLKITFRTFRGEENEIIYSLGVEKINETFFLKCNRLTREFLVYFGLKRWLYFGILLLACILVYLLGMIYMGPPEKKYIIYSRNSWYSPF